MPEPNQTTVTESEGTNVRSEKASVCRSRGRDKHCILLLNLEGLLVKR